MKKSLSSIGLAALLMTVTGCIVVSGNPGSRGNVTFLWTLGGSTCAANPDITQVTIEIPGQTLSNGGVYACNSGGTDGIQLLDFAPGTYSYTIEGRTTSGTAIFNGSGNFTVNGDVTVVAGLTIDQSAPGGAYVTWTFPPSGTSGSSPATCAQTSGPVSGVNVVIDNGAPHAALCTDGQTSPGLLITGLTAGTHTLDLQAHDAAGFVFYRYTGSFTVSPGTNSAQSFTLAYDVGSAALKWTFSNGVTQLSCAQAGITGNVYLNFRDSTGAWWYTDSSGARADAAIPCLNGGVEGAVVDYMYANNYQVFLSATDNTNRNFSTSLTTPPTLTVTAGDFPIIDGTTQVFILGL